MRRVSVTPRANWQQRVESLGLLYHTQAATYWNESAFYALTSLDVERLKQATNDLQLRCLEAAQHIIDTKRYSELGIPHHVVPLIESSWKNALPTLYGRFDFSYDGVNPPKLLEYNADTPTALLEAGIIQWFWREETGLGVDQFNSIHERLVLTWRDIKPRLNAGVDLYFAAVDDLEDQATITYLRDSAEEAGIATRSIVISDIGWDERAEVFVDLECLPIMQLFKLYPWEWLINDEFADQFAASYARTCWIEPPWKMLLSNKGILPILWELFPEHESLLETHFQDGRLAAYVRKPLLSREGANIKIVAAETSVASDGEYGEEGFVYQALATLPEYEGSHPVIGSWVIGGEAAGIGIRESDGPITDNLSRFVPHVME